MATDFGLFLSTYIYRLHMYMYMLHPCPGPTGRCTPVLGRREEGLPRRVQDVRVAKIPEYSKGQSLHSTKQDEETIICNGYKTKVYFPESKNNIDY